MRLQGQVVTGMYPQLGMDEPYFVDNGKKSGHHRLIGLCLSADATTEHECGIGPLRKAFGSPLVPSYPGSPWMKSDFEVWKAERDNKLAGYLARIVGAVGVLLPDPPLPPMGLEKRRIREVPKGFAWLKAAT